LLGVYSSNNLKSALSIGWYISHMPGLKTASLMSQPRHSSCKTTLWQCCDVTTQSGCRQPDCAQACAGASGLALARARHVSCTEKASLYGCHSSGPGQGAWA
jgi:hypothetical protein